MCFKEYKKMEAKVDHLYSQNEWEKAIEFLDQNLVHFPQYEFDILNYKAFCYNLLEQYDLCLQILREGNNKGYFFGLDYPGWNGLRGTFGYKKVEDNNNALKSQEESLTKSIYEVHTPENYSTRHKYPLFIALHGDGNMCNIEMFQKEWKPDYMIEKGFVVLYIQSSQVFCTGGYGWTRNYSKAHMDILSACSSVLEEYSIDETKIIGAGFSGGAMGFLHLLMSHKAPAVKGFIGLCPNRVENISEDTVSGLRGKFVFIEGELSGKNEFHEEFIRYLKKHNIAHRYFINQGVSHQIPENFTTLIRAIDFIMED